MNTKEESVRLDKQSSGNNYSLKDELREIDFNNYNTILDAGCGSGVLEKHLGNLYPDKRIHGIDGSNFQLEHAKESCKDLKNVSFSESLLDNHFPEKKYDLAISRYVFQHIPDYISSLKNLLKIAKEVVIIDTNKLVYNVSTNESYAKLFAEKIKSSQIVRTDVIDDLLVDLKELNCDYSYRLIKRNLDSKADRELEYSLFKERFAEAKQALEKLFFEETDFLCDKYCDAIRDPRIRYDWEVGVIRIKGH